MSKSKISRKKELLFEIMSEEEAKKFLRYNNYYFKLKSYAKNYPINPKNGKYVNLDFFYKFALKKSHDLDETESRSS